MPSLRSLRQSVHHYLSRHLNLSTGLRQLILGYPVPTSRQSKLFAPLADPITGLNHAFLRERGVTYWWVPKDKALKPVLHVNNNCFGQFANVWARARGVRYITSFPHLTEPEVRFWLRCLRHWLNYLRWDYRFVQFTDNTGVVRRGVYFRLHDLGISYHKSLLYLTAFRCISRPVDAALVRRVYEQRSQFEDTPQDAFRAIWQAAKDVNYGNDGRGESWILRRERYGGSSNEPVSLERFQANQRSAALISCQGHFA